MSMDKIRDLRDGFCKVDNEYLDKYAKLCGIHATGVYLSMCRHADKEQRCFPSKKLIAAELGIGERSVYTAIKKLEEFGIVGIEGQGRKKDGSFKVRLYTLFHKNQWKNEPQAYCADGTEIHEPQARGADGPQARGAEEEDPYSINNTHKNNTHIAKLPVSPEGALIIEKFLTINPSLKYGNRTQRQACDEMINVFGLEETLSLVDMVIAVQGKPYAPRATTPYAMWQKIGDFKVFFDSEKTKHKAPEILRVLDDDFSEQLARLDKEKGVM